MTVKDFCEGVTTRIEEGFPVTLPLAIAWTPLYACYIVWDLWDEFGKQP